jgi:hypothetical protein
MDDNQPKGIGFYNIKSGETHYARLEAQIQAYINSSDMGINASRDQDFGWRLEPTWVKKVKEFRRNETKMELLTQRNGGQKVTTTQVLYAIYGEELRAAQERAEENENPFEEEYLQNISTRPEAEVELDSPDELKEVPAEDDVPAEAQVEHVPQGADKPSAPTKAATKSK